MSQRLGFNQVISTDVIEKAKQGDVQAFEQLYRLLSNACYVVAFRMCGHHLTAEDIVHEAFIKIMKNIGSYQSQGSFSGWCRRIVMHETINRVKAITRLQVVDKFEDHEVENELFTQNWLNDSIDLAKLTEHLKPIQRAVFFLHEVEGYSHKEIADFFDKSESFSKVTLSRSYQVLKSAALSCEQEQTYAPK